MTSAPGPMTGWEPRVLVVDDDPVVRLAATRLLERLGLQVEVAPDGREAVRMSARWPYTAIFMDCYMPEVDGYETTREIRSRDGGDVSPLIIAVTSRPRHVCLAAGMDHHIAKPARVDVLERDCRLLGLIPAVDTSVAAPLATAQSIIADAASRPTLDVGHGLDPVRAGDLALAFAHRTRMRLPRLWRAANIADGDALLRLAADLAARAESVGADRIAALLRAIEHLCQAADPLSAARIEPAVEAELEQVFAVANAARAGNRPAAAPLIDVPAIGRPPEPLRVAIADDDPLARTAIEAMIRHGEGLELVGSAADAQQIVALADDVAPDVVVLDFVMPGGGGPEAARRIRERRPEIRVVALSASESPETYLAMLQAGACGLLVKGSPPQRLVELIHRAGQRAA